MRRGGERSWADDALVAISASLDVFEVETPKYGSALPSRVKAAKYLLHAPPHVRNVILRIYPRLIPSYVWVWVLARVFGLASGVVDPDSLTVGRCVELDRPAAPGNGDASRPD